MECNTVIDSDKKLREVFSHRLKQLRTSQALTLEELAKILSEKYKVGVTYGSLGNYERCSRIPNLFLLSKISDFFNVTSDYLLGIVDYKGSKNNITQNVKVTVKDIDLSNMTMKEIHELVMKLRDLGIDFDKI